MITTAPGRPLSRVLIVGALLGVTGGCGGEDGGTQPRSGELVTALHVRGSDADPWAKRTTIREGATVRYRLRLFNDTGRQTRGMFVRADLPDGLVPLDRGRADRRLGPPAIPKSLEGRIDEGIALTPLRAGQATNILFGARAQREGRLRTSTIVGYDGGEPRRSTVVVDVR